jgi:hypothetical protein
MAKPILILLTALLAGCAGMEVSIHMMSACATSEASHACQAQRYHNAGGR